MLCLDILRWPANPVLTLQRMITVFELIQLRLLNWRIHMIVRLLVLRFAHGYVDVMGRWLLFCACQQVVDVAGGASINLILLGHVAGIARQVVLVVLDESFGRHFLKLSKFKY